MQRRFTSRFLAFSILFLAVEVFATETACGPALKNAAPTRATRILSTLGDIRVFDTSVIGAMLSSGVDTFRLNASHLGAVEIATMIQRITEAQNTNHRVAGILLDLQGPKVRVSDFDPPIPIRVGDALYLYPETYAASSCPPGATPIPVPAHLLEALIPAASEKGGLQKSHRILFADGAFEAVVDDVDREKKAIIAQVRFVAFGETVLKKKKGMNFPDTAMPFAALSLKDRIDAEAGLFSGGIHYFALSFVRTAEDVFEFRRYLDECEDRFRQLRDREFVALTPDLFPYLDRLDRLIPGAKPDSTAHERHSRIRTHLQHRKTIPPQLVAKIELPQAVKNLSEITRAADGLMIARGDLGVEAGIHSLFELQLLISRTAHDLNKLFIVATHVLDGLVHTGRVSRSNATDVGFAVLSGADAIMTSEETAAPTSGTPHAAVIELDTLIRNAESAMALHTAPLQLLPMTEAKEARDRDLDLLVQRIGDGQLACTSSESTMMWHLRRYGLRGPISFYSDNPDAVRQTSLLRNVQATFGPFPSQLKANPIDCVSGQSATGIPFECCVVPSASDI